MIRAQSKYKTISNCQADRGRIKYPRHCAVELKDVKLPPLLPSETKIIEVAFGQLFVFKSKASEIACGWPELVLVADERLVWNEGEALKSVEAQNV